MIALPDRCMTPPQLARYWGTKPETIVVWIRRGILRAFNTGLCGRPRYKIPPSAIAEFEKLRSGKQEAPPPRRRQPAKEIKEIEYF